MFAFRRVVVVNGIDRGAVRDDLVDRLVTLAVEHFADVRVPIIPVL